MTIYLIDDAFRVKVKRFNKVFSSISALFFLLRIENKSHFYAPNVSCITMLEACYMMAVSYAESFRGESKVSTQLCDVTNQLYGECRRHDHSKVVRGHAPEKFCKITVHLKIRIFVHSESNFQYNAFTRLIRRIKS